MAYLSTKTAENKLKFDWDDIDVGNNQLNHSEDFFARKHFEHERLEEIEELRQQNMDTNFAELPDIEEQFGAFKIEKHDETLVEDKENVPQPSNVCIKKETAKLPEKGEHERLDSARQESHLDVTAKHVNKPVNLACQWSAQKPLITKSSVIASAKGAVSKAMPPPPQAYLVKDIYQRKREEAERRRAEEERKLREFHSRPVPNFSTYHEQMEKRKQPHACTVAVTPQVLKKSKEAEEKRKKRLEEWKQKNQAPKFESRPATVLKEKPFIPQKKPMVIQQTPFNLSTEKRLAERKHYDEAKHKALAEKKKQEEEERKRREEERIRELRKAATFKARPNPFKH